MSSSFEDIARQLHKQELEKRRIVTPRTTPTQVRYTNPVITTNNSREENQPRRPIISGTSALKPEFVPRQTKPKAETPKVQTPRTQSPKIVISEPRNTVRRNGLDGLSQDEKLRALNAILTGNGHGITRSEVVKGKTPSVTSYTRPKNSNIIDIRDYHQRVEEERRKEEEAKKKEPKLEKPRKEKAKKTVKKPKVKKAKKEKAPRKTLGEKLAERRRIKAHNKKVDEISEQIKFNLLKETRYTEPKKRGLLSRIILQEKLARNSFEYLEEDYEDGTITPLDVQQSKNAKRRRDRALYKEVQAYEDAREDVTIKKGWKAFKVGLATTLLAGTLALGAFGVHQVKETISSFGPKEQIESIMQLDEDQRSDFEVQSLIFQSQVAERDGYVFDYLTDQEVAEGYFKFTNYEKKVTDRQIESAFLNMKDQEFLDKIVIQSYGEDVYNTFTEEQKRDYRQLAFETFYTAQPQLFADSNSIGIRNPIVMDHLNARDTAKGKGYKMELTVHNGREQTVKNLGSILHLSRTTADSDFIGVSIEDGGQAFLYDMVTGVIGEDFQNLKSTEQRAYIQFAYEQLPQNIKDQYVRDPIVIEREQNRSTNDGWEIGE